MHFLIALTGKRCQKASREAFAQIGLVERDYLFVDLLKVDDRSQIPKFSVFDAKMKCKF